jgi:hypothetical protein
MAGNLRQRGAGERVLNPIAQALLDECSRQSENCIYTALSFNIWLRRLRAIRTASLVLPVIFGSLATAGIVSKVLPAWAAVFSLLVTVLPLGTASWIMNSVSRGLLLGVLDSFGRPLFVPSVNTDNLDTILGRPVVISQYHPERSGGHGWCSAVWLADGCIHPPHRC